MARLDGKIAVVTSAGQGIGKTIAGKRARSLLISNTVAPEIGWQAAPRQTIMRC